MKINRSGILKKLVRSISTVGNSFLDTTSLHGFHWLADCKRKPKGKLFNMFALIIWLISVLVALFFCLYLMVLVWKRYAASPTITTIETNNYPISNVPFPGVTICNINTVYKPNAVGIMEKLRAYGVPQEKAEMFLTNLPALISYKEISREYIAIFDILVRLGYSASKLMLELAHPCKKMLRLCSWLGKPIPCRKLFRTTKSGFGYCCSFNYQALRNNLETETNLDESYQINAPLIRTSGAGEDVSLRVILDAEANNYLAAKRQFYGTEIVIHGPEEYPGKSLLTAFGQQGTDVSIAVRASVVESARDVAKLPVNLRFCRFSNEKPLQITRKYSFQSCITECRAMTIIQVCECLPFFYPSLKSENKTIRQCGLRDVSCLNKHKNMFSSLETGQGKDAIDKSENGMLCNCLPSCSEQNYEADTFISNRVNGVGIPNTEDSISNLSSIVVYFKDLSCIKYRRELFKTWNDFLASFGGIFGLCLGGSVISLIEILYYSTFKLFEVYFNEEEGEIVDRSNQYNTKSSAKNRKHLSVSKSNRILFLQ